MNRNKGFSFVELVVVIAILGILGSGIFAFVSLGSRSYRNVGNDSDIQNEAQLTVNQIENLIIDTNRAITYSYTDINGNTTRILSDDGIADVANKTLMVYNEKERYEIKWIKVDAANNSVNEIKLKKYVYNATSGAWDSHADELMAEKVADFKVSLEKAQSKNKVFISLDFLSSDGNARYTASKQISLRNVLAINDTSEIDTQPQSPQVTGVQIFYENQEYSQGVINHFATGNQDMVFSFTSYVRGTPIPPSQSVTWEVIGNSSQNTTISQGGQLTIASDENLANTLKVKVSSADDSNFYTWVDIKIKRITGVNVAIQGERADSKYSYGQVITVKAVTLGDNLDISDNKFNWSATNAQRLTTYPLNSDIQEFKVTATAGFDFSVSAVSVSDSNYSGTVTRNVLNIYNVTVNWEVEQNYWINRNSMSNKLIASVTPDDGMYGDIRWEICWIKNETTGAVETSTLSSTSANDYKFSLSSYRGNNTSIYCGKKIDWNCKYSLGVRAYIVVNGHNVYSEPRYVGLDKVSFKVWNTDNNSSYDVYKDHEWTFNKKVNETVHFKFDIYGYAFDDTVLVIKDSDDHVFDFKYDKTNRTFEYKVSNKAPKNSKVRFLIDSTIWGRVNIFTYY